MLFTRPRFFTILLAGLLPCCPAIAAEEMDLLLVAGQSNAVGFDAHPKQLPADAKDADIAFWFRIGDPPPDKHDSTSDGLWSTLKPQAKGPAADTKSAPRQYGNFAHAEGGFGVEMGLARTLTTPGKKLGVIKAAWNGTSVAQDWITPNASTPNAGPCLTAFLSEVKAAAKAQTDKGVTVRYRGLAWVQGESDANAKDAPLYAERLAAMVQHIRTELKAPKMAVVLGVNTRFGNMAKTSDAMASIVTAQKEAAAKLPLASYVDAEGTTLANNAHFDSKGTLEMGNRMAAALLKIEATP